MNNPIIDEYGNKHWRNDKGESHRIDGPAREWADGHVYLREEWCINGKRHRMDGPAVEYIDGCKFWYINAAIHRLDGPAIIDANGNKEWYLNNYFTPIGHIYDCLQLLIPKGHKHEYR